TYLSNNISIHSTFYHIRNDSQFYIYCLENVYSIDRKLNKVLIIIQNIWDSHFFQLIFYYISIFAKSFYSFIKIIFSRKLIRMIHLLIKVLLIYLSSKFIF